MDASAGAAGNSRSTERTVGKLNVDLDSRIAAAVENLPCSDVNNG